MSTYHPERRIYDDNPTTGVFLRGLVVNRIDPNMEGRIAVHIPRLMHKEDPYGVKMKETEEQLSTTMIDNSEVTELGSNSVKVVNAMWARPISNPTGHYEIPYEGQTVYLFMEDGDPSKLYYFGIGPTIEGDNPEMYNVQSTADIYLPDKKPNIHLLQEFKDKCAIYYNENSETKEYRIHLPKDTFLSIHETDKDVSIELKTSGGHRVYISDKLENGITLSTSGGSKVFMSGDGGNIKMVNSAGATTNMQGAVITHEAGGGKITIGSGKVSIN